MASGDYLAYTFDSKEEVFNALLSLYPFESFEETDGGLIGYIAAEAVDGETEAGIKELCGKHGVSHTTEVIKPQNWNAQWEASFKPVAVRDFCRIRADFHEAVAGFEHDIVINPKMAFGTGHHETTWMMIDKMSSMNMGGRSILDFGCGTGVLAILAERLGATAIDAIDIETESYENTIENADINGCSKITAYCGELPLLAGKKYDVILANINRHVLLHTADMLYGMLLDGGQLILSGILAEDKTLVLNRYTSAGFVNAVVAERGNWRCIALKRG